MDDSATTVPGTVATNVRGTKTLLLGAPGTGKTTALATLVKSGLNVAVLGTEPGFEESLLDSLKFHGVEDALGDKVFYAYCASATPSWATMQQLSTQITGMGYEELSKIKTGINKRDFQQFYRAIGLMGNFVCDRTGKEIGPIDELGPDWAFCIDSQSGLNTMAMRMTVGAKPAAHMGEWGVAMNALEMLMDKLTGDLKCFFVLTAHIEREHNEITGGENVMVSMLGRKLAPKVPRLFSDVVLAHREGDQFFWSTTMTGVDLKARTLPLSGKLPPTFEQIVTAWKQRNQLA